MYSEGLKILMLKILENDIQRLSFQFHIPGFDREDIQQELRLVTWEYAPNYNPYKASIRTWGNTLLKGKLHKLHRDHCTTDKRKANIIRAEFDDSRDYEYEND
jgi:hypothetical protein